VFIFGLKMVGIIALETAANSVALDLSGWLFVLGIFAGIISGLFGVGGGILIVPGLTWFFNFTMATAVTISLVNIVFTATAGAVAHHRLGNLNQPALKILIPTALIGALFGAYFARILPAEILKKLFGIFEIAVALKFILEKSKVEISL
jgi:hypothetical protein